MERFWEIAEHCVSSPEFMPLKTQKDVYEMWDIFDQGFISKKTLKLANVFPKGQITN